jgi:hypothetical protein
MRGFAVVLWWVIAGCAVLMGVVLLMFNGYEEDVGSGAQVTWPYAVAAFALGVACFAVGYRLLRDPLGGEGDGSCPGEGASELGEDGQVGVKPDPLDASHSQRQ